jgi:hypothetical protein
VSAFEEIVPEAAKTFLLLALAIGIARLARKGGEAVVAGEVGKARMPQDLAVGLVATEHRGGHVVEHDAGDHPLEILEGHGQAFEQRGLALIGEAVDEQLA